PTRYDELPSGACANAEIWVPSTSGKLHVISASVARPASPGAPANVSDVVAGRVGDVVGAAEVRGAALTDDVVGRALSLSLLQADGPAVRNTTVRSPKTWRL